MRRVFIKLCPSARGLGLHMPEYSVMHLFQLTKSNALAFALLLSSLLLPVYAQSTDPAKPDNTAVNKRDQSPGEATADQQKMNAADSRFDGENPQGRHG